MSPRVGASALLLLSAVMLSGCAPPVEACTTIGYLDVLSVEVSGADADADVVVCGDGWCSSEAVNDAGVTAEGRDGDTWRFASATREEQLIVRVLDAAGSVVDEETVEPEWVRVGGDERCGGPHEATISIG